MEPQRPIFRRRHFDNPAVFNILITNYIVAAFGLVIFDSNHHVNWFFWVVMGVLGVYNVFSLYKNREELNKIAIVAYAIGLAGMGLLFLIF